MPNLLTKVADKKVAATPIRAHNPLNPPITDGFRPVKQTHRALWSQKGIYSRIQGFVLSLNREYIQVIRSHPANEDKNRLVYNQLYAWSDFRHISAFNALRDQF